MVGSASPERALASRGVLSPCIQCGRLLPGVVCVPHNRARCARFLSYIENLHRSRAHDILIQELKQIISRDM
jgi:hypothetical protein